MAWRLIYNISMERILKGISCLSLGLIGVLYSVRESFIPQSLNTPYHNYVWMTVALLLGSFFIFAGILWFKDIKK